MISPLLLSALQSVGLLAALALYLLAHSLAAQLRRIARHRGR